jgi:CRP-like cAMP-binding protein
MDVALLDQIPAFAELSDAERKSIATWAHEVSVSEGAEVVHEGDYSYEFFAIINGTAEVLRSGEKVAELGPGDFFGEIGVVERGLRGATVRATSGMRLLTLTSWDIRRLEKDAPGATEAINRVLEARKADN